MIQLSPNGACRIRGVVVGVSRIHGDHMFVSVAASDPSGPSLFTRLHRVKLRRTELPDLETFADTLYLGQPIEAYGPLSETPDTRPLIRALEFTQLPIDTYVNHTVTTCTSNSCS